MRVCAVILQVRLAVVTCGACDGPCDTEYTFMYTLSSVVSGSDILVLLCGWYKCLHFNSIHGCMLCI